MTIIFHATPISLTLGPDDLLEDVLAHVGVDGGERVVQQVHGGVVVDGPATRFNGKLFVSQGENIHPFV